MYILSFKEIGPSVPEKKTFEGCLQYMGVAASLVMRQASCHQDFHFLVPETFHTKFVQIGTVVSEKIQFEFCMYTTFRQCQEMTLTFNTHISSYI